MFLNRSLLSLRPTLDSRLLSTLFVFSRLLTSLNFARPTELISSEDTLQSNPIHSWLNIHHTLSPFLSENFILGRPYLNWQHAIFRSEIQHRYVKSDLMRRRIHTELANAFYLGFTDVSVLILFNSVQFCSPHNLIQYVAFASGA